MEFTESVKVVVAKKITTRAVGSDRFSSSGNNYKQLLEEKLKELMLKGGSKNNE